MKKRGRAVPASTRANRRAQLLIGSMLLELQRGIRDPYLVGTPEWEKLFGAKQSAVVNLQKLVQALAALPEEEVAVERSDEVPKVDTSVLTAQEMKLLAAWIEEGKNP